MTRKQRVTVRRRALRHTINSILMVLAIIFAYYVGRSHAYTSVDMPAQGAVVTHASSTVVDFSLFWDAWRLLTDRYVDAADLRANDLRAGAIDGMLAATGDPYTTYFDADELQAFDEEITGTFEGIGAEIGMRQGILVIIAPLDDSPAARAGLRPGDVIVKIDGDTTQEMDIMTAVQKIRGERGTDVILTIYREGEDDVRDITVTRDKIIVKSVAYDMVDGGIGVIRVRRFGPDTTSAFYAALRTLIGRGAQALVLDLRNNPGGYLQSAVDIAGFFLPRDTLVVYSEGQKHVRREYRTRGGAMAAHLPIIVLLNRGSASASEILAGALRDQHERTVIVGETSFGKGSVQELFPLKEGAVKITVARWFTPGGAQIDQHGIAPDEEVRLTNEDFAAGRDPQRARAIDVARTLLRSANE